MIRNCRRSSVQVLGAAALVLVGPVALAAHPLSTEDVGTQGPGALEVSTSVDALRATAAGPLELAAGVGIALALAERVDAGVGFGYAAVTDLRGLRGGLDAPELSLKWRLLDVTSAPGLAVRLAYTPLQALAAQVVGSFETGDWQLNANLGASQVLPPSNAQDWLTSTSLSASTLLHPRLRVGAEVLGEWSPLARLGRDSLVTSLLAAAQWEAVQSGVLSLGVGPTFAAGAAPTWLGTVGFTLVVD